MENSTSFEGVRIVLSFLINLALTLGVGWIACQLGGRARTFWIARSWGLRAAMVATLTLVLNVIFVVVGIAFFLNAVLIGGGKIVGRTSAAEEAMTYATVLAFILSWGVFAFGFFCYLCAASPRWRSWASPLPSSPFLAAALFVFYCVCLIVAEPKSTSLIGL